MKQRLINSESRQKLEPKITEIVMGLSFKKQARKLVRDKDKAEDLLQSLFVKAIENLYMFDGSNLQAWLYTMMRNMFINEFRKNQRHRTLFESDLSLNKDFAKGHKSFISSFLPNDYEEADQMSDRETIQDVNRILDGNILRDMAKGYKYDELAKMYNTPIGTIKSRIHLARVNFIHFVVKSQNYPIDCLPSKALPFLKKLPSSTKRNKKSKQRMLIQTNEEI